MSFEQLRQRYGIKKEYLGDGAYVDFDGYHVVLTAEDGMRATNTIYLEPEVYRCLVQYGQRIGTIVAEIRRHAYDLPNDLPGPRGQRIA